MGVEATRSRMSVRGLAWKTELTHGEAERMV